MSAGSSDAPASSRKDGLLYSGNTTTRISWGRGSQNESETNDDAMCEGRGKRKRESGRGLCRLGVSGFPGHRNRARVCPDALRSVYRITNEFLKKMSSRNMSTV